MALIGDAAILHDIGKIAIDDRILNKPGKLSESEWEVIKTHPAIGADIVSEMRYLDKVSLWVRHHHERVDGAGYPDGLASEAVPLESRIISVVDAFDAMVGGPSKEERRTYREPMPFEAACAELVRCSGTQFDEYVVMSFLRILDEEKANVQSRSDDGDTNLTIIGDGSDATTGNPQDAQSHTPHKVATKFAAHTSSHAV
jgi:HD-GYP domain-containing protein (c-di-GMP phosphodiesterase class II)